ncbi:MAG: SpoIIE family protein phosphatase [Chloroflexi bacterium]|nr:SpoIIE family protein phosphatase [Chloroflexota bacterium]
MKKLEQLEEDLHKASLYNRSLIEASVDPFVTISHEGKIMDVNKATEEATGISREQLIGTDFCDYFTEPDKAREGYKKVLSEGIVRNYPLTIRHISGKTTPVLYNATIYTNEVGEVEGVFAVARDISARKKAEEDLRKASLYNRSLIEASVDPLVTISREGKIMDVNNATEEVTGISREQLVGTDFCDYFTEPDKAREGYKTVLSEGIVRDYPLTVRHISGKTTPVLYNATVYRNEAGEVGGVLAAARDIADVKEIKQKLHKAHLEQERLTSELNIAKQIQLSVIPQKFPKIPGAEIFARTLPARVVGGDFYDFLFVDPGLLCFAIGDASGKGVPAALFMSLSQAFLKATAIRGYEPGECLTYVNELLDRDIHLDMYITLFYGILDPQTGELKYSNAGHDSPFIIDEKGRPEHLPITGEIPLGIDKNARYTTCMRQLENGIFLYSDGVTDAIDKNGNRFTGQRLLKLLKKMEPFSPESAVNHVLCKVEEYTSGVHQVDDITLLAVKYLGNGPGIQKTKDN